MRKNVLKSIPEGRLWRRFSSRRARIQIAGLDRLGRGLIENATDSVLANELRLASLSDRLGLAGFISERERRLATLVGIFSAASGFALGASAGAWYGGLLAAAAGAVAGCYVTLIALLYVLRAQRQEFERSVLFNLPLALESIILLVEAGLGLLPAIERVADTVGSSRPNPVERIFALIYRLSAHGMPLEDVLEKVADAVQLPSLRHVLLHIDVSSTQGGALVPALRSLSEYAHLEWKLSVEHRVSRLENLVVFPVFLSVLGLMVLTAAVPLVPVLEFMSTLKQTPVTATERLSTTGGVHR
jgi:Flp pilus assembly protein TadB